MATKGKIINQEFNDFMNASDVKPPIKLSESVLAHVNQELNPSNQNVFLKMLAVHTVVSFFSLSICSQFGIQTLKVYDAMDSFMAVAGHTYCMAFCGLLYLGISALAFSFLLKPEDIKVIRRHKVLQLTLLTGTSLGVFLCLGAEVLLVPGALWVGGSLIGGIASLELGWSLRTVVRNS